MKVTNQKGKKKFLLVLAVFAACEETCSGARCDDRLFGEMSRQCFRHKKGRPVCIVQRSKSTLHTTDKSVQSLLCLFHGEV